MLTTDPLENTLLPVSTGNEPQQQRITGTVTDRNGEPIPGVNVVVTGTAQGTVADIAGKYSIEVPPGSKSLTFSFVGMEPREISIGTLTQINVTLAELAIGLEEVVVIGYGTMKKASLTGSVSSISNTQIENKLTTKISQLFAGQITGIIASNLGQPGQDDASLLIRGRGRYSSAGTSPLVLVDGIPAFMETCSLYESKVYPY